MNIPTSDAQSLFNAVAKLEMLHDFSRASDEVQKAWREISNVMEGIREFQNG